MKKFFTFCAAVLMACAVNATKVNINTSTADALRLALYNSTAGDTIVMAAGTYVESSSDYIMWKRNNVVMAEEGAIVIIKPHVSFRVTGGARAELIGVKIDASDILTEHDYYENIFEVNDASAGNCWVLRKVEVYGSTTKTLLRHASDKTLDSLIIDGCYIHDNPQVILRMQSTTLKGVTIKNSTFANVANGGSFWCAPIDISKTAADAKVIVDHCTFYHNTTISSSYADVTTGVDGSATSDVTVSNCIFAQPESYSSGRAINLTNGGTVTNCLTYNYTKSTNGIQGATTKTGCITGDPLFVDAVNADYTLSSTSPALGAGTDGSNLGDPFWWPREIYFYNALGWTAPHVNFYKGSYWSDSDGSGNYTTSPQVGKPNVAMTQVGTSNVWKANYSGLYHYVSFTSESQTNMGNFWNIAGASYRGDFDPESEWNMFVPNTTSNGTYNGVNYYSNGLWAPYTITYADLNYKTLCLPVGGTLTGANAYEVTAVDAVNGVVTLSDATTTLTAGVAYIIKPTTNTISIAYAGAPVFTGVMNYLRGNLQVVNGWHADASWQAYILINNEFCKIEESATADIALYKAFLKVTDSSAPSIIRIIGNATNIENIEANEDAVKFFQNGQLFIKKNGVVYNAVGAVVK